MKSLFFLFCVALFNALCATSCDAESPIDSTIDQVGASATDQTLTISWLRQIDSLYKVGVRWQQPDWDRIGIGTFTRIAASFGDVHELEEKLEGYKSSRSGFIHSVFGKVEIKWMSKELSGPLWGFYTETDEKVVSRDYAAYPSVFALRKFDAIFPLPEKIYYNFDSRGLMGGNLVVYEIPTTWRDDVIEFLSHKGIGGGGADVSRFSVFMGFLSDLKSPQFNPQRVDQLRGRLESVLGGDRQLFELMFYAALHSDTSSLYRPYVWETLKAGLRSGLISRESGARIFVALSLFANLPKDNRDELIAIIRTPSMAEPITAQNFKSLSEDDKKIVRILGIYTSRR